MTSRQKKLGEALAGLVSAELGNGGVDITQSEQLNEALRLLREGEINALGGITAALVSGARVGYAPVDSIHSGRTMGREFFARDAREVARDLCGQVLSFSYAGDNFFGVVSETGAYENITDDKDAKYAVAMSEAGTVGKYHSHGPVTIISAHGVDNNGIVAVWGLLNSDGSKLKMHETSRSLHVPDNVGEVIGLPHSMYQLALGHPGLDSMLRDGTVKELTALAGKRKADVAYGLKFSR
tara:strand:+ start:595 stop:1311 length:717 start_codon:yes stop_codon:yes gene_type:complete